MFTLNDRDGRSPDPRRADSHERAYARRIDCAERDERRGASAAPTRGGSPVAAARHARDRRPRG